MKPRELAIILYLTLAIVFIFLPVAILVQYSFQDGLVPVPPFRGFSLRWYEKMLANRKLMEALGNSVVVGGVSSFVAVTLGFLAAYGLARGRPRHAGRLQFGLMAPLTVPYIIVGLGLLSKFDVTLPVVMWNMLNSGLNPQLNAVGTLVFATSIGLVALVAALLMSRGARRG